MARIEQSVDIDVPAHIVYDQLTQFKDYPRFIEALESVRQYDDTHLHWVAAVAGRPLEWEAEIVQQDPDHCIAWYNLSGPRSGGKIAVHALGNDDSRVTLTLDSLPNPAAGLPAFASGEEIGRYIGRNLERLKDFIEARRSATGAWRGEVRDARVTLRDRDAEAGSPDGLGGNGGR